MATIIQSAHLAPDAEILKDPNKRLWIYNGLDCAVTRQCADAILPAPDDPSIISYNFVRAMQAPALDMMLRGIFINPLERQRTKDRLEAQKVQYETLLNRLARAVWNSDLNPNSPKQLLAFFYGALGMPVQYTLRKTPQGKQRTPSCDHKALEALAKFETKGPGINPYDRAFQKVKLAKPFVSLITSIRDVGKKLAVVNSGVSPDGRLRCSYNVVGTVTGRWSSSSNVWGGGTNLQNITEAMRRMACADDGYKLGAPDLEQAESRLVAGLTWLATGDDTYWRACESGDLHTIVCTMAYPEKFVGVGGWNLDKGCFEGDLKACRAIADQKFYRHLSMRDLAKRIGHGSNYFGPPLGIAGMIGIPVAVVAEFQQRYFRAFPAIRKWHQATIRELQTTAQLTTPLGRVRFFLKRLDEDSTLREAIAHIPQSTIGEMLNNMLYRVWAFGAIEKGILTLRNGAKVPWRQACQTLLQVHDSIVFQFPEHMEAEVIAKVEELMTISLPLTRTHEDGSTETRLLHLPLEFKVGWNWSRTDKDHDFFEDGNPDGLDKYRGPGLDTRKRISRAKPLPQEWLH